LDLNDKKLLVEALHEDLGRAKVLIVTDYKGLNVAAMGDLRRKLRDAGVSYKVVKNTLLRRAAADTDVETILSSFTGPTGVAISYDDPVAPAKVLVEFAKDNPKMELRAGVMSGKAINAADIKALADLPSREVLLSQLLSVLNGVPTSLVRTLNAIPAKMVYVLQAISDQKAAA